MYECFTCLYVGCPKSPEKRWYFRTGVKGSCGSPGWGQGLLGNKLGSFGGSLSAGNYWTTSLFQSVLNLTTPKFSSFPNICVLTEQSDLSLFVNECFMVCVWVLCLLICPSTMVMSTVREGQKRALSYWLGHHEVSRNQTISCRRAGNALQPLCQCKVPEV